MKITKEQQAFIKEAYTSTDVCQEWKDTIKENFPKLLKETDLEIGKWYTDNNLEMNFLVCITRIKDGKYYGYGFNGSGIWCDDDDDYWGSIKDIDISATDKGVEEALIKESKKRGFKEGVKFNVTTELWGYSTGGHEGVSVISKSEFCYSEYSDSLRVRCEDYSKMCIFSKGEWAKIIETITKEEAEKQLGKIIIE